MEITITGPRSVGKSTVTKIVAKRLKLKYISSDKIGEKALTKHGGLDKAIKSGIVKEILKEKGYTLINDIYRKKKNYVFDLSGGSISSTSLKEASEEVRDYANKNSIVIGLLPSEDERESIKFLLEKEKERAHFKHLKHEEVLDMVKKHYSKFLPLFKTFCDYVVYTKDKTPETIADEIIKKVKSKA